MQPSSENGGLQCFDSEGNQRPASSPHGGGAFIGYRTGFYSARAIRLQNLRRPYHPLGETLQVHSSPRGFYPILQFQDFSGHAWILVCSCSEKFRKNCYLPSDQPKELEGFFFWVEGDSFSGDKVVPTKFSELGAALIRKHLLIATYIHRSTNSSLYMFQVSYLYTVQTSSRIVLLFLIYPSKTAPNLPFSIPIS